jgi:hypothetical protein
MIKIKEISVRESATGYTSCIMAEDSKGGSHFVTSQGATWRDAYENAVVQYLELDWDRTGADYLAATKKFIGG